MRALDYVYSFGIIGTIFAYVALHLNAIWLIGYLLILLIADLVPKKLKSEIIIALLLLGAALAAAFYGQGSVSAILSAFLLLATGLPGALMYGVVTLGLHSSSTVQAMTLVSESTLLIILIIQVIRLVLTKIFFVTFWIPVLDIIPILIDAAIIIVMVYLVIGTGGGSVLYTVIQNGVRAVLG